MKGQRLYSLDEVLFLFEYGVNYYNSNKKQIVLLNDFPINSEMEAERTDRILNTISRILSAKRDLQERIESGIAEMHGNIEEVRRAYLNISQTVASVHAFINEQSLSLLDGLSHFYRKGQEIRLQEILEADKNKPRKILLEVYGRIKEAV